MKQTLPLLTVAVSVYNEARTLPATIDSILWGLREIIDDYEILIIDDASRDNSYEVARDLAQKNPKIAVFRNEVNLNQGGVVKEAIRLARGEYLFITGADDRIARESLKNLYAHVGLGDTMVLLYIANEDGRYPLRLFLSRAFVNCLNILFRFHLRYYNGPGIIRTKHLRVLKLGTSNNFGLFAEIVTLLLKKGLPYKEVPMYLNNDPKGQNLRAIFRNFFGVLRMVAGLVWRGYVARDF